MASKYDRTEKDRTKQRDPAARSLAERGRSPGAHHTRTRDVELGSSRKDKHRKNWESREAEVPEGLDPEGLDLEGIAVRVASRWVESSKPFD